MANGDPLDELMYELDADSAYVTGERPFPRAVSATAAADIAETLQSRVDVGIEARARAAARAGLRIVCGPGCSACCSELIMVALPEALAVARWLAAHPAERVAFLNAYTHWRHQVGDAPEELRQLIEAGEEDQYMQRYVDQFRRGILCAFNHGGLCSIYPVRPVACRIAHALDTAEHCRPDTPSGILPERLTFVPLDEFVDRTRNIVLAAHHALGGPQNLPVALCDAVHILLTSSGQMLGTDRNPYLADETDADGSVDADALAYGSEMTCGQSQTLGKASD